MPGKPKAPTQITDAAVRRSHRALEKSIDDLGTSIDHRMEERRRLVSFVRILASYDCAGVDLPADSTALCGKCGPCNANAYLRKIGEA